MTDTELVEDIRQQIRNYHFALDMRQHGDIAGAAALTSIADVLGMAYQSGRELARRQGRQETKPHDNPGGKREEARKGLSR